MLRYLNYKVVLARLPLLHSSRERARMEEKKKGGGRMCYNKCYELNSACEVGKCQIFRCIASMKSNAQRHSVGRQTLQFSSVTQSHQTLCDPMNCSTPGLPVHHQLLVFTQTHVHLVSDYIQPAHPLLSPSPHALNLPQHQGLLQ